MNKILRKCREFGIMVRLPEMSPVDSLECVKQLKAGNIPLIVVNCHNSNWEQQLREIAFKEDLFIAAENITSLEQAYTAAGNGAQFFILNNFNPELMSQLRNSGLFFVPRVSSLSEKQEAFNIGIEAIVVSDYNDNYNDDFHINECLPFNIIQKEKTLFSIIEVNSEICDYEAWINDVVRKYLGINFTSITSNSDDNKEFKNLFGAVNKGKTKSGDSNTITMECSNIERTISYLKWKEIYVNPESATIVQGKLVSGYLDKELNGFKILLKEKRNEY